MRLYEFIDSKTYNASNRNTAKMLDKLQQMWQTNDLASALPNQEETAEPSPGPTVFATGPTVTSAAPSGSLAIVQAIS